MEKKKKCRRPERRQRNGYGLKSGEFQSAICAPFGCVWTFCACHFSHLVDGRCLQFTRHTRPNHSESQKFRLQLCGRIQAAIAVVLGPFGKIHWSRRPPMRILTPCARCKRKVRNLAWLREEKCVRVCFSTFHCARPLKKYRFFVCISLFAFVTTRTRTRRPWHNFTSMCGAH